MSLEAQVITDADPVAPVSPAPQERRRGHDRRKPAGRINRSAPRRSVIQKSGAVAMSVAAGMLIVSVVGAELALDHMPWAALGVVAALFVASIFVFLLGCLEQRLIEIRLELMMANGGSRQSDRRTGRRDPQPGSTARSGSRHGNEPYQAGRLD